MISLTIILGSPYLFSVQLNVYHFLYAHRHQRTLDLVIMTADLSLSPPVTHTLYSSSDHVPVVSSFIFTPPKPSLHSKHAFFPSNLSVFRDSLGTYFHQLSIPILLLIFLIWLNVITLPCLRFSTSIHLLKKILRLKPANPQFSPALNTPSFARHIEHIWSRAHSSDNLRSATDHYHAAIIKARKRPQLQTYFLVATNS